MRHDLVEVGTQLKCLAVGTLDRQAQGPPLGGGWHSERRPRDFMLPRKDRCRRRKTVVV